MVVVEAKVEHDPIAEVPSCIYGEESKVLTKIHQYLSRKLKLFQ